ncbi:MAG: endonuclease/exonuclease/phosphatase family protein [Planctomycetes bacterium]|nr:endonuclease/exonuclease/phosphatase family protein [Planctomycetota bacterium]
MRKARLLLIVAAIIGAAFYVHRNYEFDGLQNISLRPRAGGAAPTQPAGVEPPGREAQDTIRVASFNIQVFGTAKANKPEVMSILAEVIRSFDVVAIQEIRSKDDTLLPRFVELINATGVRYDYAIGPRLGRSNSKEQYAFIFNTATIEIDRSGTYTMADPKDLLHREPLVGMFRCRGPATDRAFTFRLVNIHTDPDEVKQEVNALDDVVRAVLADGRQEDDVILLGDLNASEHELGELGQMSGITWAIADTPTNTKGTKSYDNILFLSRETNEYTGRSGVVDMVRRFNRETDWIYSEVSDHLPIWAEFSIHEGGNRGRVATKPAAAKQ